MFTKHAQVKGTVEIWARPRQSWDEKGEDPFVYQLGRTYLLGEVKVVEHTVTLDVPEGINLFEAALDTLEAQKSEIQAEADANKAQVDQQIQSLRLLAAPYTHTDVEPGDTF